MFDFFDPDYNQSRRSVRIIYGPQRRHAFCIRHFELIECVPLHTEQVVSLDDLRLDPVTPTLGMSSTSNSNSSNSMFNSGSNSSLISEAPLSITTTLTTSGLGSNGDQSTTPTTVSMNSSTQSVKLSARHASGSSAFSSHGRGTSNGNGNGGNGDNAEQSQSSSQPQHFLPLRQPQPPPPPPSSRRNLDYHRHHHDYDDEDEDDEYGEVDSVNEMTTLEIVLPHELLEKNLQIRIAPDVENFDIIYKSTFHKTNPVIMFCFERYDDRLTETDIAQMNHLRHIMPSTPILFAHIVDFDPTYRATSNICRSPSIGQLNNRQHPYLQYFNPSYQAQVRGSYNSTKAKSSTSSAPTPPMPSSSLLNLKDHSRSSQFHLIPTSTNTSATIINNNNNQCSHHPSLSPCYGCNKSELTESDQQQWNSQNHHQCINYHKSKECLSSSKNNNNDHYINHQNQLQSPIEKYKCVQCSMSQCLATTIEGENQNSSLVSGSQQQPHQEQDESNYIRSSESLWRQLCELGFFHEQASSSALQEPMNRQQKRLSNGYYIITDRPFKCAKQNADYGIDVRSRFLCHSFEFCYFVDFFRAILKSNLVVAATLLNEIHNQFIQYFIFSAFDMTWNLSYSIPRRLEYAKAKEAELYMSLMGIANRKQDEIRQLIGEMVEFMREDILDQASAYTFMNPCLNQATLVSANNMKDCIEEIQEFVFVMLNRAIAVKLISSVDVMRETFIGKFLLSVFFQILNLFLRYITTMFIIVGKFSA